MLIGCQEIYIREVLFLFERVYATMSIPLDSIQIAWLIWLLDSSLATSRVPYYVWSLLLRRDSFLASRVPRSVRIFVEDTIFGIRNNERSLRASLSAILPISPVARESLVA